MHASTHELIALRDGEAVSPATAEHVKGCPTCQAQGDELSAMSGALQALPPLTPPADAWERIRARRESGRPPARDWRPPLSLALAASLAGMMAVGVWLSDGQPPAESRDGGDETSARLESEAMTLEAWRQLLGRENGGVSLATADTLNELDGRIQAVDRRIDAADTPEQRQTLWREKVDLLEAAVIVEASESEAMYLADANIL